MVNVGLSFENRAACLPTGDVRRREQRLALGSQVAARIETRLALLVDQWRLRVPLR
jgi:hypothetical protein